MLYNGEGGLGSVRPKGGASLVEVDLPAENGTLALDSQIASSQTPAKASVVTVNDAAPINAEDITVDITPVQLGSGTPSPDNIRPIEGWTGAELDRVGKNKYIGSPSFNGYTNLNKWTKDSSTYNGHDVYYRSYTWLGAYKLIDLPIGTYTFSAMAKVSTASTVYCSLIVSGTTTATVSKESSATYLQADTWTRISITFEVTSAGTVAPRVEIGASGVTVYISEYQLELGTHPTTYEPYQGISRTVNFGETVYGGKWHVTAGGTDKTHANIASYNGETINEPWLSSMDEYSPGATPTTGAQVVYPLTTPTTISTPKQDVPMLQGINTVYADCGDTQLKYQPDNVIGELKGEIQELESELDELDKAYMASDTFLERGIDGEYQITRISNEIHIAIVIDDASIATQTGSVDLITDLPDEFKCDPSYGAALALRHSSGTGKIEFKINPGTTQSFYMYVEEVNTTSGVWFPIYDVPGKAL